MASYDSCSTSRPATIYVTHTTLGTDMGATPVFLGCPAISFIKIIQSYYFEIGQQLPMEQFFFNLQTHIQTLVRPSQMYHLCEFELNSCEKFIRTNGLNTDLRYLSVSGYIVPQAIRPYPDI